MFSGIPAIEHFFGMAESFLMCSFFSTVAVAGMKVRTALSMGLSKHGHLLWCIVPESLSNPAQCEMIAGLCV